MSVISNRHTFEEFVSGKSKPLTDESGAAQRLAKVGYKAKSGKKSVCVSIPKLSDGDVDKINTAFPADLRKRAEDFQDSLIRSLYETPNVNRAHVSSEEIDVPQILAYLEAENNAGRLSADKVREWWNTEFQDTALPVLSEMYKTENEKELQTKANAWCDAFCSLTGNSVLDIARVKRLQEMAEFIDADDSVGQRLKLKIAGMLADYAALSEI